MLECKNLQFSYGNRAVLKDISFTAKEGDIIALLGPNGAGKSTLFRSLLGFLKPNGGEVLIDGKPIAGFSRRALAREIAYIPQSHSPTFNYTVLQSVLMGATAALGTLASPGKEDEARTLREHALHERQRLLQVALDLVRLAARAAPESRRVEDHGVVTALPTELAA